MSLVQPVPEGSIYVWCYTQGLRGVSWEEILLAIEPYGIKPREKDYRNWSEGAKKSLGAGSISKGSKSLLTNIKRKEDPRIVPDLNSYHLLECDSEEYERTRWVPCNKYNKPLVQWSEIRCTLNEARLWPKACYLAENLKGCRWIVLDFDIDHDENNLNLELREFGRELLNEFPTQALYKPDWMGFHLGYWTDKDIPTKHLPHVGIDICGNSLVGATGEGTSGQLRYFKTKKANEIVDTSFLTDEVWKRIQEYSLSKDVFRKV